MLAMQWVPFHLNSLKLQSQSSALPVLSMSLNIKPWGQNRELVVKYL